MADDEELAAMMYIPQDLQAGVDSDAEPARGWPRTTDEEVADSFSVLPRLDLDDDDDTEEQGSWPAVFFFAQTIQKKTKKNSSNRCLFSLLSVWVARWLKKNCWTL